MHAMRDNLQAAAQQMMTLSVSALSSPMQCNADMQDWTWTVPTQAEDHFVHFQIPS